MTDTIYSQVIEKVLSMCDQYMEGKSSAKELQEIIYWAEHSIVNFEEKELRNFFMIMEGNIDSIRALANGTDLGRDGILEVENREAMLKIVQEIKTKLSSG